MVREARTRPGEPETLVNWLRVFFHGGLTSYRALFAWLNPWIFLPMLVAYPVFQTVFFVYLGRTAGVANDTFFVIGNSFVAAAITGVFGMGQGIAGERRFQTLSILLASPASRLALFLGRAVPTIVNGFVVAVITFALGAALVGVTIDRSAYGGLALALVASCFACAALGMCIGSLTFRTRSISVFADAIGGALLLVTGANVPIDRLPEVVQTLANYIPLTHGIHAARTLAAGAHISMALVQIRDELLVGLAYFTLGLLLLRYFERDGRRAGSFERF
jgi:ABC-2 type transport system permease protein